MRRSFAALLVAGTVAVSTIAVVSADNAGTPTPTPTPTATATPGGSITCDQTAANAAGLTSAVSAATTGQTVCLTNAVNYGTFTGTTKAITIIAQSGTGSPDPVAATLAFGTFNTGPSTGTLVIDGGLQKWDSATAAEFNGGDFGSSIKNVTFQDFKDSSPGDRQWGFDPAPCNANVTIDHAHFYNGITGSANVYIGHSSSEPCSTGITVQRSLFRHFSADGVRLDGDNATTVQNNKFTDFAESNGAANHTDEVQYNSGTGSTIRGNWFDDCEQGAFGSDGTASMTIEYNLVTSCGAHWITVGGDSPASTIRWNTLADTAGTIICANKSGGPAAASRTNIYNNVVRSISLTGGGTACNPTRNDHNFTSAATYVGGPTPTSYAGYCIASGGALTAADDGGQAGICGGSNTSAAAYGPPTGEGY